MWRYQCKNQLIALAGAFFIGVFMSWFLSKNSQLNQEVILALPDQVQQIIIANPWLIYLSGGISMAGLCNTYLIIQFISNQFGINSMFLLLIILFFPSYLLPIGMFLIPVTLIVSIIGMVSLRNEVRNGMKSHRIANIQELIRIYELHYHLDPTYKELALEVRKNVQKIRMAYGLGVAAIITVTILSSNFFLFLGTVVVFMFALSALSKYMRESFLPISNLLYQDCNPQACMSALIYYGQSKGSKKIRLVNPCLMAECMVYLDDPAMAQDFLVLYPKNTQAALLRYWALMAATYYMLSDESGLERCMEEINKIQPKMGPFGMMIKQEAQVSTQNYLHLMNGQFNLSKNYYIERLKTAPHILGQVQCEYFIGLISFVQEDYDQAERDFSIVTSLGNQLYYVKRAQNYLEKLEALHKNQEKECTSPSIETKSHEVENPIFPQLPNQDKKED